MRTAKIFSQNRGFTLIELLVSMTLFVTIISITSGVFIQSLRTQRQTVALIAANSNASLALEQMTREIRTGTNFSGGSGQINFTNANGESVTYSLVSETLERNNEVITASNVKIKKMDFTILSDPAKATRITIILGVTAAGAPSDQPFINLQTTVSPRIL